MQYELTPEPSPDEREALLEALERLDDEAAPTPAYTSAWRRAGIRDNVDSDG